jgi:hypothetical protein
MQKTRAALTLMERGSVPRQSIVVMITGPASKGDVSALEQEGLIVLQAETTPDHPAFCELAARAKEALEST